jgi:hypothetical protein
MVLQNNIVNSEISTNNIKPILIESHEVITQQYNAEQNIQTSNDVNDSTVIINDVPEKNDETMVHPNDITNVENIDHESLTPDHDEVNSIQTSNTLNVSKITENDVTENHTETVVLPNDIVIPEINCPGNHVLNKFLTPDKRFTCDGCDTKIETGKIMHGCRICNFDLCESCYVRNNGSQDLTHDNFENGDIQHPDYEDHEIVPSGDAQIIFQRIKNMLALWVRELIEEYRKIRSRGIEEIIRKVNERARYIWLNERFQEALRQSERTCKKLYQDEKLRAIVREIKNGSETAKERIVDAYQNEIRPVVEESMNKTKKKWNQIEREVKKVKWNQIEKEVKKVSEVIRKEAPTKVREIARDAIECREVKSAVHESKQIICKIGNFFKL